MAGLRRAKVGADGRSPSHRVDPVTARYRALRSCRYRVLFNAGQAPWPLLAAEAIDDLLMLISGCQVGGTEPVTCQSVWIGPVLEQ